MLKKYYQFSNVRKFYKLDWSDVYGNENKRNIQMGKPYFIWFH